MCSEDLSPRATRLVDQNETGSPKMMFPFRSAYRSMIIFQIFLLCTKLKCSKISLWVKYNIKQVSSSLSDLSLHVQATNKRRGLFEKDAAYACIPVRQNAPTWNLHLEGTQAHYSICREIMFVRNFFSHGSPTGASVLAVKAHMGHEVQNISGCQENRSLFSILVKTKQNNPKKACNTKLGNTFTAGKASSSLEGRGVSTIFRSLLMISLLKLRSNQRVLT